MAIIKQWIEQHSYDWAEDKALQALFMEFIAEWPEADPSFKASSQRISGLITQVLEGFDKTVGTKTFNTNPPHPCLSANSDTILDLIDIEVARQLVRNRLFSIFNY